MSNSLDHLRHCENVNVLRASLSSICSRFGSIARLDILTASQAGKRQALCFLRMSSVEQEQQVMNALGVGRFGGDIVMIIDLHTDDALPH